MKFKENDIVRLTNEYFDKVKSSFYFRQNLFFFDKYSGYGESVLLRDVNEQIPVAEICPVKMDGVEDRDIYYDPSIAADIVLPNKPIPSMNIIYCNSKNGLKRMKCHMTLFKTVILHMYMSYSIKYLKLGRI